VQTPKGTRTDTIFKLIKEGESN